MFAEQIKEIAQQIEQFQSDGLRLFSTSSFQTNSVVLLDIISKIDKSIPIYMINTGFLFPETLLFRDQLQSLLGLHIQEVYSQTPKIHQMSTQGRLLFATDPDLCCHLNKVAPLEPIIAEVDVWINGIRASQSDTRKAMQKIQPTKRVLRYHPLLDWTSAMVYQYIEHYKLPKHPLEDEGYISIGCRPCTRKWVDDLDDRGGRWAGLHKTECGLHTTLGS